VGAQKPLEAVKGLVFLCHTPCVTLSGVWLTELHPRGSTGEPPSLGGSGRVFLRSGLGWHRRLGRSQGPGLSFSSIESMGLG
jgi:hypothetical protein